MDTLSLITLGMRPGIPTADRGLGLLTLGMESPGASPTPVPSTADWSERSTVDALAGIDGVVVNSVAGIAQTYLVASGGGQVKTVRAASLSGSWATPGVLQTNATPGADVTDEEGFGVEVGQRLSLVSVGGGTVRFWYFDAGSWRQYGSVVNVYEPFGSPRFPALAVHPHTWRFFVATWHGAATILSTSPDRGASWHDGHDIDGTVWVAQVDGLRYPSLWCSEETLFMVGYLPGAYQGAQGKCMLYRYEVGNDIASKGAAVTVGACDEGRPAIIMRPTSKMMTVVVPKVGATWDDLAGERDRGIVEFRSSDLGGSWQLHGWHPIT